MRIISLNIFLGQCHDHYPSGDCAQWSRAGECERNGEFMWYKCAKSCGVCQGGGGGGRGNQQIPNVTREIYILWLSLMKEFIKSSSPFRHNCNSVLSQRNHSIKYHPFQKRSITRTLLFSARSVQTTNDGCFAKMDNSGWKCAFPYQRNSFVSEVSVLRD